MPTITANTTDGRLEKQGTSWSLARNATSATSAAPTTVSGDTVVWKINNSFWVVRRVFFAFDTSGISVAPASATLNLHGVNYGNGDQILLKATAPDLTTGIAVADFDAITGYVTGQSMVGDVTEYSAEITTGVWNDSSNNAITLNAAALADMAALSIFKVVIVEHTHDYLYVQPGSTGNIGANMYFADNASNKPYLDYVAGGPPPPTITSITPSSGPVAGGTSVAIVGTDFVATPSVTINAVAATGETFNNSTSISATTPAVAAGTYDVVITNPDAQLDTLVGGYTYNNPPAISSITPTSGFTVGGTSVVLAGTGFLAGATVTIDGNSATSVVVDSTIQITCNTPAGSLGAKNVVITNTDAQLDTLVGGYTYTAAPAPTVSSITPTSGFTGGGASVVIAGTNFFVGATVTIGGNSATSVVVDSVIQITCNIPAGTIGAKDVVVTNTDSQLDTLAGGFTYIAGFGGNIASITSIYGEFKAGPLTDTLTTTLLENAASSGYVYKINSIIVANIDGTNPADLTIDVEDIAGSNDTTLADTISVPNDSTFVLIDRNSLFYLKENYRIRGGAGANGDLTYIISYERIG